MALNRQMRRLVNAWENPRQWAKRVEWIEIHGIRGWEGQRIDFGFPIIAVVGENGVGKSTVLQAIASIYGSDTGARRFASNFFPDTPWEKIEQAKIEYSVWEGDNSRRGSIRKLSDRWRGNPERPIRHVIDIDLRRTQPVFARTGYARIAKRKYQETGSTPFSDENLKRLRDIMGRDYSLAKLSKCTADPERQVTVVEHQSCQYSAFHQGAGETALVDILSLSFPSNAVVLIDEIETSLHPRAQRRLVRDLAERCRVGKLQIVLTTHSPYVLEELPPAARMYVMQTTGRREIVTGVSPYFAMTKMDEEAHPELDLYVEDERSKTMLSEILVRHSRGTIQRCDIVPFGAASVGRALGIMVSEERFTRSSLVFLDGDQDSSEGCILLPGDDAPERIVFEDLSREGYPSVADRVGRPHSETVDACNRAKTASDHHNWLSLAADALSLGTDNLWQAMCAVWASRCLSALQAAAIVGRVEDAIN